MIGRLTGQLLHKQPPWVVIDVHGVGYELEASMTALVALPAVGENVSLFTHLTIRDDAHLLYGFVREQERALFRALIKVNGVGPKLALAILPEWEHAANGPSLLDSSSDNPHRNALADAESALVSLGYKPTEAAKMLSGLDADQPTEALIKSALTQRMSS